MMSYESDNLGDPEPRRLMMISGRPIMIPPWRRTAGEQFLVRIWHTVKGGVQEMAFLKHDEAFLDTNIVSWGADTRYETSGGSTPSGEVIERASHQIINSLQSYRRPTQTLDWATWSKIRGFGPEGPEGYG